MDAKSVIHDEVHQPTLDSNDFVGVDTESLASGKKRDKCTKFHLHQNI